MSHIERESCSFIINDILPKLFCISAFSPVYDPKGIFVAFAKQLVDSDIIGFGQMQADGVVFFRRLQFFLAGESNPVDIGVADKRFCRGTVCLVCLDAGAARMFVRGEDE